MENTYIENETATNRTTEIVRPDNTVWRLDSAYIDGSNPVLGPSGWETMLFFDKGTRNVRLTKKRILAASEVCRYSRTSEEMNVTHDGLLKNIDEIIDRIIA